MNKYKIGDKIRIINMEGEPNYTGKVGRVTHIDDEGQLHGTWGGCALAPEVDMFNKLIICCLCGKEIRGYGNSALPLKEGLCCDKCNLSKVIPSRLKMR